MTLINQLYVIMRVEFTEINKPPLNYDRGTLYSLFIYISKQEKPYTKSVIKHIYRITILNKYVTYFTTSTCQGIIRNEIILLNLI